MPNGTKRDIAYHQIKQMFLERRFEPDSMLSENGISSALGISRTPVREALRALQSEGFIDIFPKKGILFRGVSISAAQETLELRAAIEGYVAAKCIPSAEKDLAHLEEMLEKQRRCCEDGDIGAYLQHDVIFHSYFIELYNNSLILGVVRSINERFTSVGFAILKNIAAVRISLEGHRKILEAVKECDVSKTVCAVYDHIQFGKSQLALEAAAGPSDVSTP